MYHRFGTAGDLSTSSSTCSPKGTFKIDLTGTPFTLSRDTKWSWKGTFSGGNNGQGYAHMSDKSECSISAVCLVFIWLSVLASHYQTRLHSTSGTNVDKLQFTPITSSCIHEQCVHYSK